MELNILL